MKPDAIVKYDVRPVGDTGPIGLGDVNADVQAVYNALESDIADLASRVASGGLATAGLAPLVARLNVLIHDLIQKIRAQDAQTAAQTPANTSTVQVPSGPLTTAPPSSGVSAGAASFIAIGSSVFGGIVGWAVRGSMKR